MTKYLKFKMEITVKNNLCTIKSTFDTPFIRPINTLEDESHAQKVMEEYAQRHRDRSVDNFPFNSNIETNICITCYEITKNEWVDMMSALAED